MTRSAASPSLTASTSNCADSRRGQIAAQVGVVVGDQHPGPDLARGGRSHRGEHAGGQPVARRLDPAHRLLHEQRGDRGRRLHAVGVRPGRRAGARSRTGRVTVNSEPSPTVLAAATVAAVQLGQLLDQRQADAGPLVAARHAAHAVEALEEPLHLGGLDAGAGVLDRELDMVVDAAQADLDRALERGLERVGDEVEDDPLPQVAVHVDRLGQAARSRPRARGPPRSVASRKVLARSAVSCATSVGRNSARIRPASSAREVEQRVDELEQPHGVAVHELQRDRATSAGAVAQRVLERAEHQRQRRAELVADVGEERGLGPVELLELRRRAGARRHRCAPLPGPRTGAGR